MMSLGDNPAEVETLGQQTKTLNAEIFNTGVAFTAFNKMTEENNNIFDQTENMIVNVDRAMQGLINTMGRGVNLSDGIRENIAKSVPAIIEMNGTLEDVAKTNDEYTQSLGRNVTLTHEQTINLFAAKELSGQSVKSLIDGFSDVGMNLNHIAGSLIQARDIANNLGANAIAVTQEVVKNIQQLNRFTFKDGVEGLARMAAQSSVLRVSMEKVFNLADSLMDPERAIELASALQRLGASSQALTDPLRLMDLAQNNVPQLQQELGKMFKQYTMFDEKTKSFKIMPGARLQLKAIADEMGIGIDQAERYALGAADIGKKLSEISFAGLDVDEDTKSLVANMATMGEGGEYKIKTESGEEVALKTFLDDYKGREGDLKKFLEVKQKEEGKTYEQKMLEAQQTIAELAKKQLDAYTRAEQLGYAAAAAGPASAAGSEFAQQLLAVNVGLAEKINRPIIQNLGPLNKEGGDGVLLQTFNKVGQGLEEVVTELKKDVPDWNKILEQIELSTGEVFVGITTALGSTCLLYTSPSPRDLSTSRMPSSA